MSSPLAPPDSAFSFDHLTKVYRAYAAPRDRLIEAVTGRQRHAEIHALRDVSGQAAKSTVVGLIGENGSGKSTLLKILAGTTAPTSGTVRMTGRVASILELGAAFHPEATGRRNVVLQAALMGLSRSEVEAAVPEIEEFAELGSFFDRPVKTYSSGMAMRLAFSVATAVLPDLVILDEALAVGDGRFQKKCVDRIFELKASGRTIFFCSHSLYYVSTLCDRAMWLSGGILAAEGGAQDVVLEYEKFLSRKESASSGSSSVHTERPASHGRLLDVRLLGAGGVPADSFQPGDPWILEAEFETDEPGRPLQIHVGVGTRDLINCFNADSRSEGAGPFVGKRRYRVQVVVDSLPLAKGEFIVNTHLADEKSLAVYDVRSLSFQVEADAWKAGLFMVPVRWSEHAPRDDSDKEPAPTTVDVDEGEERAVLVRHLHE